MDWKLVEHRASAAWGETAIQVDTDDLRTGMRIVSGPWQRSVIGALPSIAPPLTPASVETYVRGTDLVTTHPATTERPTRVQLYWRKWNKPPGSISAVLELIASVQTHLLDSDPALVIESRIVGATQALHSDDSVEVLSDTRQLLILQHPQDGSEAELQMMSDGSRGALARHTMFRRRLEKGVILRGRLLFIWSDEGADGDALQECEQRFFHGDPVLTA